MAVLAFRERASRIEQGDFAARVAVRMPWRAKKYDQTAVSRWLAGKSVPDVNAIGVAADECGVRRGWLAYGDGPMEYGGDGGPPTLPPGLFEPIPRKGG